MLLNPTTSDRPMATSKLIRLLAVVAGMSAANLYYAQPLLADIGKVFHASVAQLGLFQMISQLGYALGLFLFVPLGDVTERRRLIVRMLLVLSFSLFGVALAGNLFWLSVFGFTMGLTTIVPQIIMPMAADMVESEEQGKVVGTILSGLLMGVVLARTVSGLIGAILGWRAIYWLAMAMMFMLAVGLRYRLPRSEPQSPILYRQVFPSLLQLVRVHPLLRSRSAMSGLLFGAFGTFWTTMVFFLRRPPYHFGTGVVGLFGIAGVVGILIAPVSGRLTDRVGPGRIAGAGAGVTLLAFLIFRILGYHVWALVLGIILLDLGVQAAQIANQSRIYSLDPRAKNRLNTVFMVTYFAGGAIGSGLGAFAWAHWEWNGVTTVGAALVLISLAVWRWGQPSLKVLMPSCR